MIAGMQLANQLRDTVKGVRVMRHFGGGSFKQFKRADKVGAVVALVLGENEVTDNTVVLKIWLAVCKKPCLKRKLQRKLLR